MKQAKRLGLTLSEMEIGAIYSSPLKRALNTAQAIANYHQLAVQIERDLRELEVGELEGTALDRLGTDFSRFLIQWRQGNGAEKLPGGESLTDLRDRAWPAIQHIVDKNEGIVVMVSHYFVILTIICAALGMPSTSIGRFRVQVGSMSILDFEDSLPRLASLGDTCHLKSIN